ncbi:Lrp/AsnC family transcriptional regulator for asnA, asnC and gidA [Mumia flava]|uniref:Lrp/AsnC family transcriptional regulator for asnA, asnC and gidA n=1 Tax=Mumia flava TaxID=1348852 RepID=A0A0B2B5A6_9ACTN|nr:Lrp/AsnC family transcriptional regulator [Mumia flava]PJJ54331.1 Lrp/AsnC family transcriptional regulator for asnA, asnC and gidA [Mumia flava]
MAEHALDELDRAIIGELESDGRRAFREIARNLGASEATVRARVKRLQELNVLRIVAFADPEQLGGSQLNLMLVRVTPSRHQAVVETLTDRPEVTYLSTLLGSHDLCIEVSTTDNAELWQFVQKHVQTLDGVQAVETLPILKVHKLRYANIDLS